MIPTATKPASNSASQTHSPTAAPSGAAPAMKLVEDNVKFLQAISKACGRTLTVAECYIAYALRDGKYKAMSDVPQLPGRRSQ
jgi:hypothetical protein